MCSRHRIHDFRPNQRTVRERGFVAIEFVLGLGLLMLPIAILVTTLPTWSERQSMARSAAREAARTFALTGSQASAQQIVYQIADNYHIDREKMTLNLSGNPSTPGTEIQAEVSVQIPAVNIPILGASEEPFSVTESHTEITDLYRVAPSNSEN